MSYWAVIRKGHIIQHNVLITLLAINKLLGSWKAWLGDWSVFWKWGLPVHTLDYSKVLLVVLELSLFEGSETTVE